MFFLKKKIWIYSSTFLIWSHPTPPHPIPIPRNSCDLPEVNCISFLLSNRCIFPSHSHKMLEVGKMPLIKFIPKQWNFIAFLWNTLSKLILDFRHSNYYNWNTCKGINAIFSSEKSLSKVSKVAQSCPTLCDPSDCSLPGFSHGIFQARVLEWVAISFSRRSSPPRDRTRVSRIVGRCFTVWATREVFEKSLIQSNYSFSLNLFFQIIELH